MVVHFVLTLPTIAAVRNSWKFVIVTIIAMIMRDAIAMVIKLFILFLRFVDFAQFRQSIFDPDSLYIAEKAHKHVEIGE